MHRLPSAAREHFNLVYHGTMAERLGVDLLIRAVAGFATASPVFVCTCGAW